MKRDPRRELLTDLRETLESLLATIESDPSGEPAALNRAWKRCESAFAQLREAQGDDRAWPAELRPDVEACLRLYAVASGMLARARSELLQVRAHIERARAQLGSLAPFAPSGRSCDVSG
jgi:hypothetical protein